MSEVYIKEPATKGKAIFRTTHGDLEIELWSTETPKACRNFCQLILEGYYDGSVFHRVIKDFIIQGGDATNTGDGSESIYGKPYPDEIHPRLKFRYRGMMGIASAGKGTKTNGSQFFIVLNRSPSLDGKHTLFGRVVGQTIYNLVRISEVEVDKRDRPREPPRIIRAELVWDPFDDLEPRCKAAPPPAVKAPKEHRRAPVHNKRVLSFAASDGEDDDDDDAAPTVGTKGKSAHDLLDDPKLLRDAAYPEGLRQEQRPKEPETGRAMKDKHESEAKRVAAALGSKTRTQAPKAAAEDKDESAESAADFSGSEEESEEDDTLADERAQKRQQTIQQLKRDIVGMGASGSQDNGKSHKPRSALEELQAGYKKRKRVESLGKESRRKQADLLLGSLKSFQSRIRTVVGQEPENASEEAGNEVKKAKAEEGTFAAIWQEGEEESTEDWLAGAGLKFHVSADKAFELQSRKARENLEIFDPLLVKGNDEQLAEVRKKRAEGMLPHSAKHVASKKKSKDDDRRR